MYCKEYAKTQFAKPLKKTIYNMQNLHTLLNNVLTIQEIIYATYGDTPVFQHLVCKIIPLAFV